MESLTIKLDELGLEVVIGLETHVTVTNTKSKLFCACANRTGEGPNVDICPICTGQMGVLPQVNKSVVQQAIKLSHAIGGSIAHTLSFDRKHYSYPDLPKGYQLTQFRKPISQGGKLQFLRKDGTEGFVDISHFHIEEDPAKLTHSHEKTFIDYNRSGKPLFEVVTTPSIHSIEDVILYMEQLQRLVRYLEISDADMEKGHFKSDISISLRKKGTDDLNPRTEIKNLNSFRFALQALELEISQQINIWKETNCPQEEQQTKGRRENTNSLEVMRKKEYIADYKFMEEPDIPEIDIDNLLLENPINIDLLPFSIEKKLTKAGLTLNETIFFSSDIDKVIALMIIVEDNEKRLYDMAKILINLSSPARYDRTISELLVRDIFNKFDDDKFFEQSLLNLVLIQVSNNNSFDYLSFIKDKTILTGSLENQIKTYITDNAFGGKDSGKLLGELMKLNIIPQYFSRTAILSYIKSLVGEEQTTLDNNLKAKGSEKNKEKVYKYDYNRFIESYRTHRFVEIDETLDDRNVVVAGWIQSIRDHGDLVFIDLRSEGEILQIQLDRRKGLNIDSIVQRANESVISVHGKVTKRSLDDINPKIRLGGIEISADQINLLSGSQLTPFEVSQSHHVNETKRMLYRYLDLRNIRIMDNITKRHEVVKYIRNYFDNKGFIHVDTPILGKPTDEGSREFYVPSRLHPNTFYTLPQAPQQLKQILMGSGVDKYYQIARCFRDEDPKGDRQPEFTQVDLELSYVHQDDIINLISHLLVGLIETIYPEKNILDRNIPHYNFDYIIEHYGIDKPDMRYGLKMRTVTDIVSKGGFKVFNDVVKLGGVVKCMLVEGGRELFSKKYLDSSLREFVNKLGGGGLANFHVGGDINFVEEKLGKQVVENIINFVGGKEGDTLLFAADKKDLVNSILSATRTKIANDYKLYKDNDISLLWVRDFPMFEKTDEGKWKFTHNPFSMPRIDFLGEFMKGENIDSIIAQQYDIVMNGNEIGGGSIRAHLPEILSQTYKIMGYSPEETDNSIGHIINAFQYGFPPHGGLALGLDRILMILQGHNTIREVIPFPKTGDAKDLLMNAPSFIKEEQLKDLSIKFIK